MKIKDFINDFNKLKTDEDRKTFVEQIVVVDYVPFIEKADACLKIINDTWYKKDEMGRKKLHITSTGTYVLYTMVIINKYTDLDVDFKDTITQYDLLNKEGLLGIIMLCIPEKELSEFKMILEMTQNDVSQNEYYAPAYISNRIESISTALGATLVPAVEGFSEIINDLDENKVKGILGALENSKTMKILMNFVKR